jgi:hypothetical protein
MGQIEGKNKPVKTIEKHPSVQALNSEPKNIIRPDD